MEKEAEAVKKLLKEFDIKVIKHKPSNTAAESAELRGIPLMQGVKSLILDLNERIKAGEFLGISEDELKRFRKERVCGVMMINWGSEIDYIGEIRQVSEKLDTKDMKEIAREVYKKLMPSFLGRNETPIHLGLYRAAQLAKEYLGEDEFHRAGKEMIKRDDDSHSNYHLIVGLDLH